jgi:hypothetical protein
MTIKPPKPDKGRRINPGHSATTGRIDYSREKPTFCLRFVDPSYCITACEDCDKAGFADKIRRMSQMTWNDLIQAPRHGMGLETIPEYKIKKRRPPHVTEDVTLIAFRFSGMKTMVGYRQDGTFHIVWFDRDFTLYEH